MKNTIVGNVYGKLTVTKLHATGKNSIWECICECGNKSFVSKPNLNSGNTKSCGCLNRQMASSRNATHGHSRNYKPTKIYNTWMLMIRRCTKPQDKRFMSYGGRGITVCKDWLIFENFLRDMGKPNLGDSLDRIDNNKGYCKENCRWANSRVQNRNKRTNHLITCNGTTKCLAEWSEQTGILPSTIYARLIKYGWSVEKSLGFI